MNILNYIKYCLGYVKIARNCSIAAQQKYSLDLPKGYFSLVDFLKKDIDDKNGELINLAIFYKFDPKSLSAKNKEQYENEKDFANKIEDICNKHRNDEFTKQIILNFGYFEIEISDEQKTIELAEDGEEQLYTKAKISRYPLFSLPIKIKKETGCDGSGKYFVLAADSEVQINIGILEPILGEDLYEQLLKSLAKYENGKKFSLPGIDIDVFFEIWQHQIKSRLRLTKATFDDKSFSLDEIKISLGSKSNYFLTEDLKKLSELNAETLQKSSLACWENAQNNELDIQKDGPAEKDLYFPFLYDKYQLSTLSLLANRASIIQGPPGTGKSETIANILCHLAANGKRVLFVSQKAQALKVVKDKLKKLKISYLFGYIPNQNSTQLSEEDEADGIAPQLSSLQSYIEKLENKNGYSINQNSIYDVVGGIIQNREELNKSIAIQKAYFKLHQEFEKLAEYHNIKVSDLTFFANNFSAEVFYKIIELQRKIENLKIFLAQQEKNVHSPDEWDKIFSYLNIGDCGYSSIVLTFAEKFNLALSAIEKLQKEAYFFLYKIEEYALSDQKRKLDMCFSSLDLEKVSYTDLIKKVKNDLMVNFYYGNFKCLKIIKNFTRKFRLRRTFKKMPIELCEYINDFITQGGSRIDINNFMDSVIEYLSYFDNKRELENKKEIILSRLLSQLKFFEADLPHQIIEWIRENLLKYDITRQFSEKRLSQLIDFLVLKEKNSELSVLEKELNEKFKLSGISKKEFAHLEEKLANRDVADLENIKDKILQLHVIQREKDELLSKIKCANDICKETKKLEELRRKRISVYIQNIINQNIILRWKMGGVELRKRIRTLASAFEKSKRAFKTFDNLRNDPEMFKTLLDLIPVWIMELDDSSRIVPFEDNIFDYVILDEASQCNIAYTLPVMHRAEKILFVGDREQMRDSTVMFMQNSLLDQLASRHDVSEDMLIKGTGFAVQSVLDLAYKQGFLDKFLHYYYRSPFELIGFSNEYFYKPKGRELIPANTNYVTYEDTSRIMLVHEVKSDWGNEISDNINVAEANAILDFFKKLRGNGLYKNKSVGILSFFNAQANYIRKLFEVDGFKEESDNYKVSIIDGIQGDEKDIVIYSFVIRTADQKNKYVPLTGESGDVRADINRGRVNVAFSRARLQVHCFVSLPIDEIPDKIWIKKYLEYVQKNGSVNANLINLKSFDSYFEEEFYGYSRAKLGSGYLIQNQVESCGFKIDFVISNCNTGKRIAVECDGPCHFKDEVDEACEIYVDSDEERQRILESAGWSFYRIKYTDWIDKKFDRNVIFKTINNLLK